MNDLLTPKQVAQAIGVSESSLKRWCDRGLIDTVRTPGGHRRMTTEGVMSFLRHRNQPLVRPELLGLPSNTGKTRRVMDRAAEQFREALAAGDEEVCRQVILDLYLAEQRLSKVFDQVFAPAYHRIGEHWQSHGLEIYRERRAVEIGIRIVGELRRMLPNAAVDAPVAFGATCEADPYQLSTNLIELTLKESGWHAVSLGSSLPFTTLTEAIQQNRPRLFWLSVSAVSDEKRFVRQCAQFFQIAESLQTAVVIGGRALVKSLRQAIPCSAYCDNLQQLETFAASLHPTGNPDPAPESSP